MMGINARIVTRVPAPVATLRPTRVATHNDEVNEDVERELAELSDIARRVIRRRTENRRDEAEIKRRLPALRAKGVGPADLERAIYSVFVQGTISRWTKDHAES